MSKSNTSTSSTSPTGVDATKPARSSSSLKIASVVVLLLAVLFYFVDCDISLYFLPYDNVNKFAEQVVWVTGASGGIGARLAKDFTIAGATVVISARRQSELDAVARECSLLGAKKVMILPLDVTDHAAQQKAYDEIIRAYGRVDTLVLNPGRTQRALALDTSIESTRTLMDLNFLSYVGLTKVVLPNMVARGAGSVVVMSSISGKMGTPVSSTYSASKWALHGYFEAVRAEYSRHGVHVLLVCPGPVVSEIAKNTVKGEGYEHKTYETEDNVKMSTERCSHLTLKALSYKFDEVWVSKQPFLLITYLAVYTPGFSRFLFKKLLGPTRVDAFLNDGNVFDVWAIVKSLFQK